MIRRCAMLLALGAAGCAPHYAADPGPAEPVVEVLPQQEILTPLPMRVSLPRSYEVEYVLVLVLTWGSQDWDLVQLHRRGQTWSGEVSCRQVSTVTGDTRYFFLALDGQGEVVTGSGSPQWPYVATVVGELPHGPQALAGDPPPLRCHDPADCPPDFPGCPAYAFLRPQCSSHDDCDSGYCEWDGYCTAIERDIEDWVLVEDDELFAKAVRNARRHLAALPPPRHRQAQ